MSINKIFEKIKNNFITKCEVDKYTKRRNTFNSNFKSKNKKFYKNNYYNGQYFLNETNFNSVKKSKKVKIFLYRKLSAKLWEHFP